MAHDKTEKCLAWLFCAAFSGVIHAEISPLSEQDYFSDLPEVLTVTRLAQPLSETPGAVTIIDRETIRRSGARELADVLRLVPGYLVAGINGAMPNAAYHVPIDDYGSRNLVLVDGRTVFSSLFLGGTSRGMMGLSLEDVERVEVLRGSNSAAFGANAMFGVINIVTRHTADTRGGEVAVTGGTGQVSDAYARIGWGDETASFRLSAGQRRDAGYRGAFDDKDLRQFQFRADLRPAADQELMLAAGGSELQAGDGFSDQVGNPERTTRWHDAHVHAQWRKQLSGTDDLKVSASYDAEALHDLSPYAKVPGLMLDFGGKASRLDLELQHQIGFSSQLRGVWGVGYKREEARSQALFDARSPVSFDEKRLFGNLEWRPGEQWTVNAGGFLGDHSRAGSYFVPRLMANFHLTQDHTLRAGVNRAERPPTLFELDGDIRYYLNGVLIGRKIAATGNVSAERLMSKELGYFGNFRDWRLTLDMRIFQERMQGKIATEGYDLTPAEVAGLITGKHVDDYVNGAGLKDRGLEYQLRWKPLDGSEIWFNHLLQDFAWADGDTNRLPPRNVLTLALFQKLPKDLDLTVMFHSTGIMTWRDDRRAFPVQRRLDVRLAMPFHIGSTRAEAALTVQAANGGYLAFFPYLTHPLTQERRAFATLRLEF